MKAIQILTDESIYTLQRAVMFLEVYNGVLPTEKTKEVIDELKEIIKDCKEN